MQARCPACGEEVLFAREPVYDGFTKTGEVCRCTSCGVEHPPDAVKPVSVAATPNLFSDDDQPEVIRLEGQGEDPPFCRYCTHYIVNAFTQRCGQSLKEVDATDTCEVFERDATAL